MSKNTISRDRVRVEERRSQDHDSHYYKKNTNANLHATADGS